MKKEIIQENRARWELFEQIGPLQAKLIWAAVVVVVVLGGIYLLR